MNSKMCFSKDISNMKAKVGHYQVPEPGRTAFFAVFYTVRKSVVNLRRRVVNFFFKELRKFTMPVFYANLLIWVYIMNGC